MDDLTDDLITELRQLLDETAAGFAAWADQPGDPRQIEAVFQMAHRIKGSSAVAGLPRLVRLAHAAEDVLAAVRSGDRPADAPTVAAVRALIDRIGEVAAAMAAGEALDAAEDDRLIASIRSGAAPGSVTVANPGELPVRTVRLHVERLDRLMEAAAELEAARDGFRRGRGTAGEEIAFAALCASIGAMCDAVAGTRLQRLDQLFAAYPRTVRDLAAELGRVVTLELAGGEIELDRDVVAAVRDPLVQVIRNAVDHGIGPPEARRAPGKPPGGTLRVLARIEGGQLVVEVADDGDGIDADKVAARAVAAGLLSPLQASRLSRSRKLALVFTPGLSTAAAVTAVSGRGVGLDVVRTGIERAGGVVEIETESGIGTLVRLKVPLRPSAVGASSVAIMPVSVVTPLPPKRRTCLVVDDSRVVRTVARYMLEGLDFTVEEAGDGQEGLERCRASCPDVVLLDRNMPGMDGITFLREIGRVGFGHRPKILFCTADSEARGLRDAISAGADALMLKPFDPQTLRARLAALGAA